MPTPDELFEKCDQLIGILPPTAQALLDKAAKAAKVSRGKLVAGT